MMFCMRLKSWSADLLLVWFFLLSSFSCHSASGPDNIQEGKRNYNWLVDTISSPGSIQTLMRSIYATSPTNVYLVGDNDQPGPQTMFHYNGYRWGGAGFHVAEGGPIEGIVGWSAISGIGANNIWVVGERDFLAANSDGSFVDSSLIIHFDGAHWKEFPTHGGRRLSSVWVNSASDAWAVGYEGSIFHFNGLEWVKYDNGNDYYYTSVAGLSWHDMYTIGRREDKSLPIDSTGYFLYHYDGYSWRAIDSIIQSASPASPRFGSLVWSDRSYIYSLAPNITRLLNSQWQTVFSGNVAHMNKSSDYNMFAVGDGIYHYNGINWKKFDQLNVTDRFWFDCYTNGSEVFVVGNDLGVYPQKTIILHGK